MTAQGAQLEAEAVQKFVSDARLVASSAIITGTGIQGLDFINGVGAMTAAISRLYGTGTLTEPVVFFTVVMASTAVFLQTLASSAVDEGAATNAAINEEALSSANVDRGGLTSRLVNSETVTVN